MASNQWHRKPNINFLHWSGPLWLNLKTILCGLQLKSNWILDLLPIIKKILDRMKDTRLKQMAILTKWSKKGHELVVIRDE